MDNPRLLERYDRLAERALRAHEISNEATRMGTAIALAIELSDIRTGIRVRLEKEDE